MSDDLTSQVDLERGERFLGSWPAEPAAGDRTTDRPGWLVLTSRHFRFFQKSGLFGNRLEKPPRLSWKIEELSSVAPQRFWMKIGYGDRLEMPGLGIDGYGFRLNRDTPSGPVIDSIRTARDARRTELGYPLR